MMCVGAMCMGFYRGWSDSPTAVSDSTAQVLRRAAPMRSLAQGQMNIGRHAINVVPRLRSRDSGEGRFTGLLFTPLGAHQDRTLCSSGVNTVLMMHLRAVA